MDLLDKIGISLDNFGAWSEKLGWANILKISFELIIITYCIVWLWGRIRGTQAERLLKGVLVLALACVVSWLAGFTLITSILQHLIPVAVLALMVVFQPEIRRGLGYLGRGKTFRMDLSLADTQQEQFRNVINELIVAVRELSRTKIGALIVVEPPEGERDYLSPGTPVNADVSSNLLISIFYPKCPMHDGAVVIRKEKIVAAGVILHTMTDNPKLSYRYGTRHRAAIGLSEVYDALCIIVSEETGSISAASHGMLVRYNSADELSDPLHYLYFQGNEPKTSTPLHSFLTLFGRSGQPKSDTEAGGKQEADNLPLPPEKRHEEAV